MRWAQQLSGFSRAPSYRLREWGASCVTSLSKIGLGKFSLVTVKDRVIAMAGCFAAGAMVVGAKAATIILAIWVVVVFACVIRKRSDWADLRAGILSPPRPLSAFLVLGLFASLSAFWAREPAEALKAGALLCLIIVLGHALRVALDRLSPAAAMLVAGWFVIGLAGGCILLFAELYTNFGIFRWAVSAFPEIRPSKNSMIVVKGGNVNVINRSFANWSVAGLNLLTWPSLLILSATVVGRWRLAACGALAALTLAVTFTSEHETSKLAVVLTAAAFAASLHAGIKTQRTVVLAAVVLILSVVPLAQISYSRFELHNAGWAQFTLKERVKIWGYAADSVWKTPVLGIGANNTTIEHTQKFKPAIGAAPSHHPHNMVLQIWLELGALGASLLLVAAVLTFIGVGRLCPMAVPFGYATAAMAATQSMATWNLWHEWIQAAFMMSFCILMLGNRLVADIAAKQSVAFAKIWLPEQLKRVLSKSNA